MARFTILSHQPGLNSVRPLHWDLLFECGEVLRTFACLQEPTPGETLPVEPLHDHRLAYLEYEGPIAGDRGEVTRWDSGEFEVVAASSTEWLLDIRGQRCRGRARFFADVDQRWMVEFAAPTPSD